MINLNGFILYTLYDLVPYMIQYAAMIQYDGRNPPRLLYPKDPGSPSENVNGTYYAEKVIGHPNRLGINCPNALFSDVLGPGETFRTYQPSRCFFRC